MSNRQADLVFPSPSSRVRLPFEELARSAAAQAPRALEAVRLDLALRLRRDPSAQELWDHFRELHPEVTRRAHRAVGLQWSERRRRARHNPYEDQLPARLDDSALCRSLLGTRSAEELEDPATSDAPSVLRALKDALARPKRGGSRREEV